MKNPHNFISVAFVATLGLAACDRNEAPEAPSVSAGSAPSETVMQPDKMPAPAPEGAAAQAAPAARDSAATGPLDKMTPNKESNTMPEAGHGNNHSSPALKKSTYAPRKPAVKVIWI